MFDFVVDTRKARRSVLLIGVKKENRLDVSRNGGSRGGVLEVLSRA